MCRRWFTRGFILFVALTLAACSSSAGSVAPASSTPAPAGATPPTVTAPSNDPGADGSPEGVDVCSIVTAADIEQQFPGTVTATTEPTNASGCSYTFSDADEGLDIEVVAGDQASSIWQGNLQPGAGYTVPLSGIGDQAMRSSSGPDIVAIKGATFCEVEVGTGVAEVYAGFATPDPQDDIPEASSEGIAQKIGAFCTKVFAAR